MQPRVTFKGNYSGTFSRSYTINPQATYITRLSKLSKGFAVNLRRLSSATATGYQVQYSLYRNFKGAKVKVLRGTSMNIRGLQEIKIIMSESAHIKDQAAELIIPHGPVSKS